MSLDDIVVGDSWEDNLRVVLVWLQEANLTVKLS